MSLLQGTRESLVDLLQFSLGLIRHVWLIPVAAAVETVFQQKHAPLSPAETAMLYGCAFFLMAFGAWRDQARRIEKLTGPAQPAEKREFLEEPLERLLALRREPAGWNATAQVAPLIGKWVRVPARAEALAESLADDSLYLTVLLAGGESLHLQFAAAARERLRRLRQGQPITAICKITGTPQARFFLTDCELAGPQSVMISNRPLIPFEQRPTRKTG